MHGFYKVMNSINEAALFRRIEAYSELVTVVLFLIGSSFRYKELKYIGRSGDKFSALLFTKIGLLSLLIALHLVYTVVMLFNMQQSMSLKDYLALIIEAAYIAILVFAVKLLLAEHLSRLSEVWYCHKLLYAINILAAGSELYLSSDLQVNRYCVQFNWASLALNLALVFLQCLTPKRSRHSRVNEPLLDSQVNESPFSSTTKVDSSSAIISTPTELTEAQIALITSASPVTLHVKFSDMKIRNGERVFSFSTRVNNLPNIMDERGKAIFEAFSGGQSSPALLVQNIKRS
jgi:hypothetical protein